MAEYWYVPNEHGPVGPVTAEFLRKFLSDRAKWWDVPVWKDGFDDWMKAGEIVELRPPLPEFVTHKGPPPWRPDKVKSVAPIYDPESVSAEGSKSQTVNSVRSSDLIGQKIKWFARIGLGLVALFLILVGAGARRTPHEMDQIFGLITYAVGIAIIFIVFFGWKRTAMRAVNRPRAIKSLAIAYLIFGVFLLAGIATTVLSTSNGGLIWLVFNAIGQTIGPTILLIVAFEAIALMFIGLGLLNEITWARTAAVILAFPLSFGWPGGFIFALCTWRELACSSA